MSLYDILEHALDPFNYMSRPFHSSPMTESGQMAKQLMRSMPEFFRLFAERSMTTTLTTRLTTSSLIETLLQHYPFKYRIFDLRQCSGRHYPQYNGSI